MFPTPDLKANPALSRSRRGFLRQSAAACASTAALVAGFPQTALAQALAGATALPVDSAARWLRFTTFAPLDSEILDVATRGYGAWLETQMLLPQSRSVADWVRLKGPPGFEDPNQSPHHDTRIQAIDWKCVYAADPLRQRVTYALSNLFVISEAGTDRAVVPEAYSAFWDLLNRNAFGNFRTLIEDVTYSLDMGFYLTYLNSRKADAATGRQPDENYARELMQLFTIGLWELNEDGSRKLDGSGQPIPTYQQTDIVQLARVFTGLYPNGNLRNGGRATRFGDASPGAFTAETWGRRMAIDASQHAPEAVRALGGRVNIAAGTSGANAIRATLDALFQHPTCPPFVALNLIRRLTCSNPSPGYVSRVSRAFVNNGSGVRGDMKAVLRAIFLDPDLLTPGTPNFGMLVPRYVYTMGAVRRLGSFDSLGTQRPINPWLHKTLGSQRPFTAPTVFNFNKPDYATPELKALGLVGAELENYDEDGATTVFNGLGQLTRNATLTPYLSAKLASSANDAELLDELSRRLSGRVLPSGERNALLGAIRGYPRTQTGWQRNVLSAMLWTILIHPQNMVLS
ncbi:DUF1800 family protein [Piscinibacter sp. Jin2]|uniref:DUF1800 family protein n=1 Tax=Aquariibacter lacus TaxID=2801332 RepID=A0A9X0XBN2_9BURK|nr:DUF1800 family protein [Piscinibacter lacus]MBL0718464.1 DUF1800 family protein [Piscinibacter lacus]